MSDNACNLGKFPAAAENVHHLRLTLAPIQAGKRRLDLFLADAVVAYWRDIVAIRAPMLRLTIAANAPTYKASWRRRAARRQR